MSSIKVYMHQYPPLRGRWYLRAECLEHDDFLWTFDSPSTDPEEWGVALMVAYGHACMEHRRKS